MLATEVVYVSGHTGLVGSAVVRYLKSENYKHILVKPHGKLDLTKQRDVAQFFGFNRPHYVIHCAGLVGGILANMTQQGDFLYKNSQMALNVIWQSSFWKVRKLLFLGSSCIYPTECPRPIKELSLFSGKLEPTNEGYAVAKILGIEYVKMCRRQYKDDFISAIPCNVYGQNDNFDKGTGHFLPAMIKKVIDSKETGKDLVVWGSGKPKREFIYSDDLAEAIEVVMEKYSDEEPINIGTGEEISIEDCVNLIREAVGHTGEVKFDSDYPDGMMTKVMDVSKIKRWWTPKVPIEKGIKRVVKWYYEYRYKDVPNDPE